MNDGINLSSNAAEASFPNEEEESQNCSTEDNNDSDKSVEEEAEKDRLGEMRMAQMFIADMQNQQHSTQPSTSYHLRGNQVPFCS